MFQVADPARFATLPSGSISWIATTRWSVASRELSRSLSPVKSTTRACPSASRWMIASRVGSDRP